MHSRLSLKMKFITLGVLLSVIPLVVIAITTAFQSTRTTHAASIGLAGLARADMKHTVNWVLTVINAQQEVLQQSVNLALEASRGLLKDAGAGFAVVAEEVRNLAIRAAEAARDTSILIESSVNELRNSADLVDTTSSAFDEAARSARKATDFIGEIAVASNEQAQGIGRVNSAVVRMNDAVRQNTAGADESASISEEMSVQAGHLEMIVEDLASLVDGNASVNLPVVGSLANLEYETHGKS